MKRREFLKTMGLSAPAMLVTPHLARSKERFKTSALPETEHFDVRRVGESVFAVRGKPDSGIPTNTAVIVGDRAVAVVDTHQRPSFDEEVIRIVGEITDLPIRYLINTHWHQDHTLGNQAYEGRSTIVGHVNTGKDLLGRVVDNLSLQREVLPGQLDRAIRTLADRRGQGVGQDELSQLAVQIELDSEYLEELGQIRVVAPTELFDVSYSLDISDQPIELRYFGPGHTHGDIVIFLPEERTLISGDLLTPGQPFMRPRDAVPSEWGPTLAKIGDLPWEHVVPGHGWIDEPRDRVGILVSYLGDLTERVRRAVGAGVAAEEIIQAVNLEEYEPYFPYFSFSVGENIRRAYEELTQY
jgi:cyclase